MHANEVSIIITLTYNNKLSPGKKIKITFNTENAKIMLKYCLF